MAAQVSMPLGFSHDEAMACAQKANDAYLPEADIVRKYSGQEGEVAWLEDRPTDTQVFIVRYRSLNEVHLAFRGTIITSPTDLTTDLGVYPRQAFSDDPFAAPAGIFVHSGFMTAYKSIEKRLEAQLNRYVPVDNFIYETGISKIFVTGHSLGGALATLAFASVLTRFVLKLNPPATVKLYTFGAPMVGSSGFKKFFEEYPRLLREYYQEYRTLSMSAFRITAPLDPFPNFPIPGLVQAGDNFFLQNESRSPRNYHSMQLYLEAVERAKFDLSGYQISTRIIGATMALSQARVQAIVEETLYVASNNHLWERGQIGPQTGNAWTEAGEANAVTAMASFAGSLYAVSNGRLRRRGALGPGTGNAWTEAGEANAITAMASFAGSLYAASNGRLWKRGSLGPGTGNDWTEAGEANAVTAMASFAGSLYAASNGRLWKRGSLGPGTGNDWTEAGEANAVTAMASFAGGLYVVSNGRLWRRGSIGPNTGNDWSEMGEANNVTGMTSLPRDVTIVINGWPFPARLALRATVNGLWVCAEGAGRYALFANRVNPYAGAGSWEIFDAVPMGGSRIALRATVNCKFVTVGNDGLIANKDIASTAQGSAEMFEVTSLLANRIALRAVMNGRYVCAEDAGRNALMANRDRVGSGETFEWKAME